MRNAWVFGALQSAWEQVRHLYLHKDAENFLEMIDTQSCNKGNKEEKTAEETTFQLCAVVPLSCVMSRLEDTT